MPNLYMGRGGLDGLFGPAANPGSVGPVNPRQINQGGTPPPGIPPVANPIGPVSAGPQTGGPAPAPAQPPNVVGPEAIRASGPSQGYDPSYLQNLATSIGALFANPQSGNTISFNPLGNLSEVSPSSGIGGNAPGFGAPLTWLQQALNGLGFSFGAPPLDTTGPQAVNTGTPPGNGGGGGRQFGGRYTA